jgi:hypothetical protein
MNGVSSFAQYCETKHWLLTSSVHFVGLSEAEIQKRLAEETDKLNQESGQEGEDEDEDSEEDQDPVNANGKIMFRKPKGSKIKGRKETVISTSSKKNFEETLLSEAEAKVNALKRKGESGSSSTSTAKAPAVDKKNASSSGGPKKKKQKAAKTTSLLSFDDEE